VRGIDQHIGACSELAREDADIHRLPHEIGDGNDPIALSRRCRDEPLGDHAKLVVEIEPYRLTLCVRVCTHKGRATECRDEHLGTWTKM